MNDPRVSTSHLVNLIEKKPFDLDAWADLAQCLEAQNDKLSSKSIEVILDGLKKMKRGTGEVDGSSPSTSATSLFIRLARSYNNPDLLKGAGELFLKEWNLPTVALSFFERSMRLGGPEAELEKLRQRAQTRLEDLPNPPALAAGESLLAPVEQKRLNELIFKTGPFLSPQVSKKLALVLAPARKKEGPGALPATGEQCLHAATRALESGDLEFALRLLQRATELKHAPAHLWEAWSNYARVSYDLGYYEEMERGYRQAQGFDPANMTSHFNLGLACQLTKKIEEAEKCYLLADQIENDHPKVWSNLGSLYFQSGQIAKAEAAFKRSLKVDPNYARAWDNLAATLGAQNRVAEAKEACQNAIRLRPIFPEAYFKLGMIFFYENDFGPALNAFAQAALLPQLSALAQCFTAIIHARRDDLTAAREAIDRAIASDSSLEMLGLAWSELGKAQQLGNHLEESILSYEAATLILPKEPEIWINLGTVHQSARRYDDARTCYQQALDLDEKQPTAWRYLGMLHFDQKEYRQAADAFRAEILLEPQVARSWFDLGVCLQAQGLSTESNQAFATAYQNEKRNPSKSD